LNYEGQNSAKLLFMEKKMQELTGKKD
jgi:hypothetical protein